MPTSAAFLEMTAKASEWLHDTMRYLAIEDEHQGLHALRAGLHTLRDRLPVSEVVDLAAQLPTIIRGIYFEGWQPRNDPTTIRTRAALLARVRAHQGNDHRLDPEAVMRAVMRVIAWHVSAGEINDIMSTMPQAIANLLEDGMA
ncbi:MAG: DUF2267 domain-containing protein [Deltaproteobacteria bacterium]|nr:DUF2267 domain-containing protein [Deltaproteobacteria bacterium]